MAADAAGWATASLSPGQRSCWTEDERGGGRERDEVVEVVEDREWGRDCGCGTGIPDGEEPGTETEAETAAGGAVTLDSGAGSTAGSTAVDALLVRARFCRATPCCRGKESLAGELEVLDSLARPMAGRFVKKGGSKFDGDGGGEGAENPSEGWGGL